MEKNLFTWLHLSDLHFGHGPASHRWDQRLVLQSLIEDLTQLLAGDVPRPNVILITGDIAQTGASSEYDEARAWFSKLTAITGVAGPDILVLPGNHDVQRQAGQENRHTFRLLQSLRTKAESIDEALGNPADRELLAGRLAAYLEFERAIHSGQDNLAFQAPPLYWEVTRLTAEGLLIRFVGLNTALLSADDRDRGCLYLGQEQLANTMRERPSASMLLVVLSHHPCDWLGDGDSASKWLSTHAHVHLFGHVHEPTTERVLTGGGSDLLRVVAGAVHHPDGNLRHCYSCASITSGEASQVYLRLWPRVWSDLNKDFRINIEQTRDGLPYVNHPLPVTLPPSVPVKPPQPSTLTITSDSHVASIPIVVDGPYHQEFPPLVTTFVGRKSELRLLGSPASVVALTGIGGQGKSALAASYLASHRQEYQFLDWRDCREQANKIHTQLVSILERFTAGRIRGAQLAELDDEQLVHLLFSELGSIPALLVFDNIDQYVSVDDRRPIGLLDHLIRHALTASHHSRFMFTCRPSIDYESDGFLQVPLSGLSLGETEELFFAKGVIPSLPDLPEGIRESHALTQGHALWLNLIATQVARASTSLSSLVSDLRESKSSHLPSTLLRSIWKSLNEKQKEVLRCLAEALIPEPEERIADYVAHFLNWNQYTKALRQLRRLDLVVVKPIPGAKDTFELHPLIREFVRNEYSRKEREPYIIVICEVLDKTLKVLKAQLVKFPGFSVLQNWIIRTELAINRADYQEALSLLAEVNPALRSAGYAEEFVRVGMRLLAEIDWTKAIVGEYQQFDLIWAILVEELSHLGRWSVADRLIDRYQTSIGARSARYVNLCGLASYSYWMRGDYENAKAWGKKGVELKRESGLDTKYDSAHNLALARRDSGEVDSALQYFLKDQTVDELLATSGKDERASHVFGNVGRCLWLKSDRDRSIECFRRSAQKLASEADPNTIINQGWAALWLSEALEQKGECDIAYYFLRFAEMKWQAAAPPKALIAGEHIVRLLSRHPELSPMGLMSQLQVGDKCREWLKLDTGSKG